MVGCTFSRANRGLAATLSAANDSAYLAKYCCAAEALQKDRDCCRQVWTLQLLTVCHHIQRLTYCTSQHMLSFSHSTARTHAFIQPQHCQTHAFVSPQHCHSAHAFVQPQHCQNTALVAHSRQAALERQDFSCTWLIMSWKA